MHSHAQHLHHKSVHDILTVTFRWLHITSIITLLGGILFARFAVAPAVTNQPNVSDAVAARFRPIFYTSALLAILSGLYNFLQKHNLSKSYHAIFGIKMLLVVHILAAGYLALKPNQPRRNRQFTGIVISGLVIVALSAVLRFISASPMSVTP